MNSSMRGSVVLLACCTLLGGLALVDGMAGTRLQAQTPKQGEAARGNNITPADWREQNAYTLGVQAYLYAFPWAYMPDARWLRTEAIDRQANRFDHIRKLEDAAHLSGGAPNNDTLYSRAWVYLKDEPVILSVPAIRDRYYTMEIVDFMGDNFAYVGVRTTGTEAGNYAIVGPGWKGDLPGRGQAAAALIDAVGHHPGPDVREGPGEDLKPRLRDSGPVQAHAALAMGEAGCETRPQVPKSGKPLDPKTDPLAEWKTINRAMIEVPPAPRDADTAPTNCPASASGRGWMSKPGCRAPARAGPCRRRRPENHRRCVRGGYLQKQVNGWNYPPPATGRPTPSARLVVPCRSDACGLRRQRPRRGDLLERIPRWRGEAPVGGESLRHPFRQRRAAKGQGILVGDYVQSSIQSRCQPINRYSLGDRSGMKADEDGSLTIYLQKDSPGADKESNWLPAPEGKFFLILRTYLPAEELVNQTWAPPPLTRVK